MSMTEHAGPRIDPTPIFELYRGYYATALLTAATSHFDLFGVLASGSLGFDPLREKLGLAPRAATVLLVALRAMGLIRMDAANRFELTDMAREHLLPDNEF